MGMIAKLKSVKRRWWILSGVLLLLFILILARPKDDKPLLEMDIDPEITPTMFTRDARSYVSDSGYVRYMIEAPLWYVFDEAQNPNWKFNKGIYLEKYGNEMQVDATFICDSAIYLTIPKLWEFVGNVRMRNELGDRFLTQRMYWDTNSHKIYSDSFIHIEKADRIIEGYGFVTDEKIRDYTVRRPTMIIPVSDFNRDRSTAPDSIAAAPSPAGTTAAAAIETEKPESKMESAKSTTSLKASPAKTSLKAPGLSLEAPPAKRPSR